MGAMLPDREQDSDPLASDEPGDVRRCPRFIPAECLVSNRQVLRLFVKLPTGPSMKTARVLRQPEPALRVVIAEADDDTRGMYREALRRLPLEIVDAADGRE